MHISDVKKFVRCPRMYQLSRTDNSKSFPFFNININIEESMIRLLGIEGCYTGYTNESTDSTFSAMESNPWLARARFSYRGLRVRVPFLYHQGNNCRLYFTSFSINPMDSEAVNIKWTCEVLRRLGLNITDIFIIHPNRNYIRQGEIDDSSLWNISDSFCNSNGHPTRNILQRINELSLDVDMMLDQLLHFDAFDSYETFRSSTCMGRNKCSYYDICFPDNRNIPDNSVLYLTGSQYKYQMFDEGLKYLSQIDTERLEGSPQQFAQIMADRNGGLFCDRLALGNWLEEYRRYPMSFIDFEWDLYLVPPYDGMHPLQVLPFQYSLHIMNEKHEIVHHQFIGEGDCRRQFIEEMMKGLPESGPIFAYNARGAEILRLQEFQEMFPEYHDYLQQVIDRFVDLASPFITGVVYDVRMKGNYSLKVLQGIIDREYSYKDLEIDNGLEAVRIYRELMNCSDPQQKQEYYDELYKYCGLDSYAMIEVYDWLCKML